MLFYQRILVNKPRPLEVNRYPPPVVNHVLSFLMRSYLAHRHQVPVATPIPAAAKVVEEEVEKIEERIVHIKADENRGLTRVNGVVAQGSFWEVLEYEDSACSRQKRPHTVFRVEIAPTAVRAKRRKVTHAGAPR